MDQSKYDPSAPGIKGTIFGLPFNYESAEIIIYPIPWEVTTSYSSGTAIGPQGILEASTQLDLELFGKVAPWKKGIWMQPIDQAILSISDHLREVVVPYIDTIESGQDPTSFQKTIDQVNQASENLKLQIKSDTHKYLSQGKKVGLLGGDHSCPLGYMTALAEIHQDFGILQIDAHMDLRLDYEGFEQSHASIMRNALTIPQISKIVQVGIRDYCEEELNVVETAKGRVEVFYDQQLRDEQFRSKTWHQQCIEMVAKLPKKVYISFDIDGLDPSLCPGTGTPVPGGLNFNEVVYLLNAVVDSGREVIGFDLCEVAPHDGDKAWNANVGARVLYQLCGLFN